MTRPLAEFIIHTILFLLDQLRAYVHEDDIEAWGAARNHVEAMSLKVLAHDDQFG